ncbi:hypothetical protein SAMN04515678_1371, partial [Roseivivax sediminis]
IADAIEASGKSQREIATEMGYERPNVVSMMKNGDMRMPLERIPAFAAATGVDAELMLRTAMLEYMPATWEVVAASRRQTGSDRAFPVQDAQINIRGPAPTSSASSNSARRSAAPTSTCLCSSWTSVTRP